jgi:hypothetical protein
MSVKPTSFDDGTGMWTYVHDDGRPESHGGTLDPATVTYGQKIDGTPDQNVVVVPCPEGDAVSYWPPGGGADALMGQSLHVVMGLSTPTVRGARAAADVVADVKARVIATDGEERWVLDEAALSAMGVV